jgi:chemotaxis protein MotB
MARRKKKHEDHTNHEAWAIPYGDLITLLLAFFVVMYAISSVNEGKFRVLSDSLNAAFRGAPTSIEPVHVGEKTSGNGGDAPASIANPQMVQGQQRTMIETIKIDGGTGGLNDTAQTLPPDHPMAQQLSKVADELETSLQSLVDADLVAVRRHEFWLEVEVRTDILFPSGIATLSNKAIPALDALATTLVKHPNPVRVEGHTDNRPIANRNFPSNWELSAARAASVVHRFANAGVHPDRLSVIGFGEFRPTQSNDTAAGRDANRRVVIVILAGEGAPAPTDAAAMATEASQANAPGMLPPLAAVGIETPSTPPPAPAGTETAPLPVNVNAGGGNPSQE